jgi:hypothetical protein
MVRGDLTTRFGHIALKDEDIKTELYCDQFGLCAGCDNNIEGEIIDVAT